MKGVEELAAVREEEVEVGKELKGVQAVEEEGAEEQVAEEEGAVREEGVDERTGGDVVVDAVGAPLACLRTFREIDKITAIVGTPVARTVRPSLCQHSAACPSLEGVRSGCGGRGGRCGRGGCEVRGVRPYRPLSLYRARPCGGLPNAEMQRDSKAGAVAPPLISPPRSSHRSTAQGGGQGGSPLAARGARTQVHGPPSSSAALKIELELEAWD